MPFFISLTEESGIQDILKINRSAGEPLIRWSLEVMRNKSPLSEGQRELIAAFVSGLNSCRYCYGVHSKTAQAYGIESHILENLLKDINGAPIDDALKPILHFVRILTLDSAKLTMEHAQAVYSAGWSERALHDAIQVCCVFNCMNRLANGHGIVGSAEIFERKGKGLKEFGYDVTLRGIKDS